MKKLFFIVCSATYMVAMYGQKTIQGRVIDAKGTLPGASIIVSNSVIGTISNADGVFNFSIPLPMPQIIEVRHIGYKSKSVKVNSDTVFDVLLDEGQNLSEVVISGIRGNERSPVSQKMLRKDL